jgi:NAD-dependent SIR2 family protein deacetylase
VTAELRERLATVRSLGVVTGAGDPPDAVAAIGTTASFPYVVEPVLAARRAGRLTIEINPQPTELSPLVDFSLRARAGTAVPALCAAIGLR